MEACFPVMAQIPDLARLERLERLARNLNSAFRVPGTGIRVGYDSILGLIPGIGDVAAAAPAAYIVLQSHRMGAPNALLLRQGVNIAIDTVLGAVPLLGDLFDVGYKANRRNVALLRTHLERQLAVAPSASGEGDLASHHPSIGGKGR